MAGAPLRPPDGKLAVERVLHWGGTPWFDVVDPSTGIVGERRLSIPAPSDEDLFNRSNANLGPRVATGCWGRGARVVWPPVVARLRRPSSAWMLRSMPRTARLPNVPSCSSRGLDRYLRPCPSHRRATPPGCLQTQRQRKFWSKICT